MNQVFPRGSNLNFYAGIFGKCLAGSHAAVRRTHAKALARRKTGLLKVMSMYTHDAFDKEGKLLQAGSFVEWSIADDGKSEAVPPSLFRRRVQRIMSQSAERTLDAPSVFEWTTKDAVPFGATVLACRVRFPTNHPHPPPWRVTTDGIGGVRPTSTVQRVRR